MGAPVGERSIDLDDVSVGDAGPPISHTLTRTDLVMYAGASGDFNPMHSDDVAARAAGLPGVFGHGMFSAALLARAVTDFVGVGNLKSYQVRFTRQTWPGEVLTSSVTVAATRDVDGAHVVDLDCRLSNEAGEVKVEGRAVAVLSSTS
jgi:acyl dehydratase